jgi:hypothetical protein
MVSEQLGSYNAREGDRSAVLAKDFLPLTHDHVLLVLIWQATKHGGEAFE